MKRQPTPPPAPRPTPDRIEREGDAGVSGGLAGEMMECCTKDCLSPAVLTVFGPGQTRAMCPPCARRAREIARAMGFELSITNRQANARLIAAAPELLAALERLAQEVDTLTPGVDLRVLERAHVAIAKARGGE